MPFLISLMTFVSIKNTPALAGILNTLKIRVFSDIRHAHQHLRKCPSLGPAKRIGQNGPMFGLGAPAVSCGLLAQALNDTVIHVTHQKICHGYLHPIAINDSTTKVNCNHCYHRHDRMKGGSAAARQHRRRQASPIGRRRADASNYW
ncbi:hypothetical protein BLAT2472_30295 [Burkholderia latens]